MITVSALLVATLVVWLATWGNSEPESPPAEPSPPTRRYETITVRPEAAPVRIPITGRIRPYEQVDLYPEVSGTLRRGAKPFKKGISYQRGQTILRIDSDILQLDVASQKSAFLNTLVQMVPDLKMDYPEHFAPWDAYLKSFSIDAPLPELPAAEAPALKYFLSARNVYSQYYSIRSMEQQLRRYRIVAPFTGTLTQAPVNPGGPVTPQTLLGVLSSTESYELETSVSLADLEHINPGDTVTLTSNDLSGRWTGTIQRVGEAVDDANQRVPVFVDVAGDRLRAGLFLEGSIATNRPADATLTVLPLEAIVQNDRVYVIQDSLVELYPIEPLRYQDERVWVRGLADGQQVIRNPGGTPLQRTHAIAQPQ